jgi:phospholipid/cholesterol/gamma-HCH transport system substrate-binding protein
VKRAIAAHRVDFAAIAVLVVAAIGVTIYILEHQPSFVFGQSYYTVQAPFTTAAAVTAGQGQAVTIAGVQVGQVGGVTLRDGQAVVTMNIYKQYAPIYRDATVLLRPRTPLKDMYLELDPGSRNAGRVPDGGSLSIANTQPDVDLSEILSSLDSDTRNYLVLLLSAGAQAFHDPGARGVAPSRAAVNDLSATFKRFAPLDRDTERFTTLLATRQRNIRRAIHNLNLVANAFGGVQSQLASLIRASDTNFSAIAANDTQLEQTLTEFPPTLRQTQQTLAKVQSFATASTTTLQQLQPFARNLGPALKASRPLFRDTTPVIAGQRCRAAAGADVGGRGAQAQGDDSGPVELDLGAQHPLGRARPYVAGSAELPVLGLLAGSHRRQPGQRPGRERRGAAGDLHEHLRRAELL